MTLTKEWLLKTISELELERDAIPGAVNEDAAMSLEAMKMALASLTAEPVAWMVRDIDTGEKVIRPDRSYFGGSCQPLYTAAPAPVVPDAIPKLKDGQRFKYVKDGIRYSANYANGWNACRAAMLQGAENAESTTTMQTASALDSSPEFAESTSGNSPAIPDWQAEAEKMAELHGSSFVVFRNGESPQCADSSKVIISFTDEGLGHGAAAPQQEVK